MSSAARYSPTPVPLPPLPFHNSVVVLQGPPSPLVVQPENETNVPATINFVADQARDETSKQSHVVNDFVNAAHEEELVTGVDEELILMPGEKVSHFLKIFPTNDSINLFLYFDFLPFFRFVLEATSELEAAAAPLMLAGIPGTEFALTRDFLVMQDDQINVMSTLRNQEINVEPTVVVEEPITEENGNEMDLPVASIIKNIAIVEETEKPVEKIEEPEERIVRRSRRQINDKKTFSCEQCDSVCHKTGECTMNNVRTIADQPVPSRAIATLPGSYLSINKLPGSNNSSGNPNFGVFAKRNIRSRTQFGPIEGILRPYDGTPFENSLPLIYETENGEFLKIDVSNESTNEYIYIFSNKYFFLSPSSFRLLLLLLLTTFFEFFSGFFFHRCLELDAIRQTSHYVQRTKSRDLSTRRWNRVFDYQKYFAEGGIAGWA